MTLKIFDTIKIIIKLIKFLREEDSYDDHNIYMMDQHKSIRSKNFSACISLFRKENISSIMILVTFILSHVFVMKSLRANIKG